MIGGLKQQICGYQEKFPLCAASGSPLSLKELSKVTFDGVGGCRLWDVDSQRSSEKMSLSENNVKHFRIKDKYKALDNSPPEKYKIKT